jgi:hypothetical protein
MCSKGLIALPLLALALCSAPAVCQELAPRAYWPGPKGLKVFSIGYSYTDGDVLLDPALPVDGVDNKTHGVSLAYYQILGLVGRTAGLTIVLPAAATDLEARVGSEEVSRSLSGFSDLQVRFAINLIGAPTMTPQEFQKYRESPPRRILGTSLKIQAPTGKYNNDQVANIGTSRWAAKPELGYIQGIGKRGRWGAEITLGAWIYGDNTNYRGKRLEQRPMFAAEFHLVHRISSGKWISFDWNFYEGGQTTVGGFRKDNRQENSRYGATFGLPIKRHVLKAAFSNSFNVREGGGDYLTVLLSYSYVWN